LARMRVPTTERSERRPFRVRGWMIAAVVIVLVVLFSLRGLAGFYTDSLWFGSLGQGSTFRALLGAKVIPALAFTAVFFVLLMLNLVLADRLGPKVRPMGPPTPEDELVARYQQTTARYTGRIRVAVSLFFALIAGIGVSSQWKQWILFTNATEFDKVDPQFHKDIGFYVFKLPFINFIIDWLFAGLVIVLLVTAVAHYMNGGIRFQSPMQRVTPQVKAHLSVILAIMALVKTAEYYFSRYELTLSDRGVVDGASYTDVKAQLPALNFLIFVSVIAAALFVWNIWRRGWVLPVIAVGLWVFVSLVVGTIYPAAIQNFKVTPNEFANEAPYIRRNIVATRDAFDLETVAVKNFDFTPNLDSAVVEANLATIDNARLWDPNVIQSTYQTLQAFQTYYKINDVDIDRYLVDGQVRQVLISARDLNSNELPSQSWVNERLVYTHGYGGISSPSNAAESDGAPVFFLGDIPTNDNGISLSGKSNEIYLGEGLNEYVIVGAKQDEFNFPREGRRDAQTRYDGDDGVELSNLVKRAAFALRFSDPNILISGQITGDSKVLMLRNVIDRVEKLAPFLDYDGDPYPAIVDGRLVWILDGYTTSSQYPYSQQTTGIGGISGDLNYVRNSVKVTIDAYEGTVKFFVIDKNDPIIRAYAKAFPDLFTPGSDMPKAVREHLRYPEDLFRVQSNVFANYHVTEPRRFYQGSERWLLTPDPNVAVAPISTTNGTQGNQSSNNRAPQITADTKRQDPYYLYIRLPGDKTESFLILQPFVPVSNDNKQTRLISFMTAKSDPSNYGELEAFVTPQGTNVTGPVQAANNIQSDVAISQQLTLLRTGGSSVRFGNLQLIPVGQSIVYIQPIFVQQTGQQGFPQFRFVAVFVPSSDQNPVIASSVQQGINELFGLNTPEPEGPDTPPTTEDPDVTVADLLRDAAAKFTEADQALKDGDLGRYQELVAEAQDLVNRAARVLSGQGGGSGSTTTTTSPTAQAQQASAP
jgi:hypothetical protein